MKNSRDTMKTMTFIALVLLAQACSDQGQQDGEMPTQQEVNRSMESINRQMAMEERAQIDGFVDRMQWTMTETGTGLRYMIYEEGKGQLAKPGQMAVVNYKVSLLNGDVVYTSEEKGSQSFVVNRDNVESGLHEGIQLMKVGDKARFILPSHLAHGLTGDNDRIPPRSSVVYDIELLELK